METTKKDRVLQKVYFAPVREANEAESVILSLLTRVTFTTEG